MRAHVRVYACVLAYAMPMRVRVRVYACARAYARAHGPLQCAYFFFSFPSGMGMDSMAGVSVVNPTYAHLEDMTNAAYVPPSL